MESKIREILDEEYTESDLCFQRRQDFLPRTKPKRHLDSLASDWQCDSSSRLAYWWAESKCRCNKPVSIRISVRRECNYCRYEKKQCRFKTKILYIWIIFFFLPYLILRKYKEQNVDNCKSCVLCKDSNLLRWRRKPCPAVVAYQSYNLPGYPGWQLQFQFCCNLIKIHN